jgi:hypothetical protein
MPSSVPHSPTRFISIVLPESDIFVTAVVRFLQIKATLALLNDPFADLLQAH